LFTSGARWVGMCLLVLILAGSFLTKTRAVAASPLSRKESPQDVSATFVELSEPAGIDAVLQRAGAHAGAWGDVNGDGYPDLFWGSWTNQGPNRLLINNRDGTFTESVQKCVNRTDGRASGSVFADLDNDGDLDLIVVSNWRNVAPCGNQLLRNDGKGQFTDVSAGSGLDLPNFSGRNAFVLDYDGDGLLDVILQHDMWGGRTGYRRTFLLRNTGKLVFKDVTVNAGLPGADEDLVGLGGAVGDVNGDTWVDFLHVGARKEGRGWLPDIRLYINNRNGTFRLGKTFDFSATFPRFGNSEDWACGGTIGDLNGDGKIDAVVGLHYGSTVLSEKDKRKPEPVAARAYLNLGNDMSGTPRWRDITQVSGLKKLFIKQPHVDIQDFNNDGRMDVWNSASMPQTSSGQHVPYIQYNLGNDPNGIPHFAPPPGLSNPLTRRTRTPDGKSIGPRYGAVGPTADYDLDGRLDIFRTNSDLFRNTTENIGEYLTVKVDLGTAVPNRFGVGARVSVYAPGRAGAADALLGVQLIEVGNGYCSGRPATAHFGVPGYQQVDVVVQMPCDGAVLKASNVRTNQILTVSK
jgi:hypothetical protein